jgi:hypothetical protein
MKRFLRERGRAHFTAADPVVLCEAAEQLARDRKGAKDARQFPLPGQAEYLDLLRALTKLAPEPEAQRELLGKLATYTFRKHPGAKR